MECFHQKFKKISYSLGLRNEYTEALPWANNTDEIEKQQYFKLFLSVNVT